MPWISFVVISTVILSLLRIQQSLSMVITPITTARSSMVNPSTALPSMHLLRLFTRNSLIEKSVSDKQLSFIENQLRQKRILYRRMPTDGDGIIILIGPFYGPTTGATKQLTLESVFNNTTSERIPSKENRLDDEYTRTSDRESYEFRHCLEACEIFEDEELKPDHDCIRKKCLDDITGI